MTSHDTPVVGIPAIHEDYRAPSQTTLTVTQKYWSWFKNTGRGFIVTQPDGSTLFAAGSSSMGRHRPIENRHGQALFDLKRSWTSMERAWVLVDGSGNTVLTVKYNWIKPRIHMEACVGPSWDDASNQRFELKGTQIWSDKVEITAAGEVIGRLQCVNTMPGWGSSFKVTPPVWSVEVSEGVDMALMTVLTVCVSDAFSEGHLLML